MMDVFVPHDYYMLDEFDQQNISLVYYQECIAWYNGILDAEVVTVTYSSDGLLVKGIIAKPKNIKDQHPVIVYARGGSGESGKINVCTIREKFYFWLQKGYVVVAPQYRGVDGGQGIDELGGADVHDVQNVFSVINALNYANLNEVYMIGHSRGAMMALMALRCHFPVKSLALTGAVTDFFTLEMMRPDLIPLFNRMIPGMSNAKHKEYTKRSAVYWADEINVPVLIMHGDADTIIDASQSYALSDALKKYDKQCSLIIYKQGTHSLKEYQDQVNQEIAEWFLM